MSEAPMTDVEKLIERLEREVEFQSDINTTTIRVGLVREAIAALRAQAQAEPVADVVDRAAGVLCEAGALCGWPAPNCNAREGAEALFKAGLLASPPPALAVEAIVAWVRDDVLPAYGISSEAARNDVELAESAHAAFTAAAPYLAAPKWRTMDSAPKDGARILACRVGRPERFIVWWDKNGGGWRDRSDGLNGLTHWLPLPTAPGGEDVA